MIFLTLYSLNNQSSKWTHNKFKPKSRKLSKWLPQTLIILTSNKRMISISLNKWNSRKWLQLNRSLYRLYKMSNSKMAIQIRSFLMCKVLINSQRRYAIFPQIPLMRKRKNGLMWWPYSVERESITTKQEYKLNPKPNQFIRKENIVIVSLMKTTILFKTSHASLV